MVILYGLLAAIDYIIYSLAASMFRVIIDIASVEFFTDKQITGITSRIYIVVGVLMLFKLVISAIQFMINPDSFDDKEKGLGGILKKTVISIALMVLVPSIFNFALAMQKPIVESIPNVVFGTEDRVDFGNDDMGMNLSFQILSSFVTLREGHENKIKSDEKIHDIASFQKNVLAGCPKISLFGLFGSIDDCHYDYKILISTAAGVFLCYILFVMILDVAVRMIKFGLIQVLAPIPISSYVLSKDKLNNFVKMATSVYLDLFIRLAVIYFVIFAIKNVFDAGLIHKISGGDPWRTILVNIAIVLGLLKFAQKAPDFITDLLGLKDVASGDMKDMFTRAGGMFGATVGAGKSFISSRANARNEALKEAGIGADDLKGLGRKQRHEKIKKAMDEYKEKHGHGINRPAFRSAGSALRTGTYQAYWKGKGYSETYNASDRSGQRSYDLNKALEDNNVSRGDYRKEIIKRKMGINSNLDIMNAEIEAAKAASDRSKAGLDYVHGNIAEKFGAVKFTDAMVHNADFMKKIQVTAGVNNYSFGNDGTGKALVNIDLTSMGESGNSTIAGIMNDLKTVIENQNGKFSGNDRALASRMLDKLQGEADKYIINSTKAYDSDPSLYDSMYKKLGFDKSANPAFMRLVQEALEANIVHSADTQYGRSVWKKAMDEGILYTVMSSDGKPLKDESGNVVMKVRPDKVGDWLALNKKEGQNAQTANIEAKGTQAAQATIKSIADKYDKK